MRKPKIMLVDDSELLLDVIGATLRDAGYEVIARSVPVGAGAHILRERPDLVLLDVSMPLMSGAEISESIRKSALARGTCIVLHSDRPAHELADLAERCGADGYIRKSSDPGQLVSEVQGWLERSRAASTRRPSGPTEGQHAFVACAPRTRAIIESELRTAMPLRYTDSGAELLRHVCSTSAPALVIVGTSLADVTCSAIYRAACRSHPSWKRRFVLIDEPSPHATSLTGLEDLPRWSSDRPVAELSMLIGRLAAAS